MLINILTFAIPIIQFGLPLLLIYKIWTTEFRIKAMWLLSATHAVLVCVVLFTFLRWDVVGYGTRYWLYGLYLIAMGLSFTKVKDNPLYQQNKIKWQWGKLGEIVVITAILVWVVLGFKAVDETEEMSFPLKGKSFYVLHGGSTPVLNYHGAFAEQQKYALDITKLNDWGFRADGLLPTESSKYVIFGDTVYSPLTGTVVHAVDSLPDQSPPNTFTEQPLGNHIWLKKDSLYVVLAHLKHGSLKTEIGAEIPTGQPVAQVGNTGNTTEPHLHLHSVVFKEEDKIKPDSLLYSGGLPVPITFDERFLIRNSIF